MEQGKQKESARSQAWSRVKWGLQGHRKDFGFYCKMGLSAEDSSYLVERHIKAKVETGRLVRGLFQESWRNGWITVSGR